VVNQGRTDVVGGIRDAGFRDRIARARYVSNSGARDWTYLASVITTSAISVGRFDYLSITDELRIGAFKVEGFETIKGEGCIVH
jgi:hypothetical protein